MYPIYYSVKSPITKMGVADTSRSGDIAFLDCSYSLLPDSQHFQNGQTIIALSI